jgi:energy-coupling factor transporter transmembrane protein EcfT
MKFSISSFCLPAKIYLALAILSIVISLIISVETIYASIIHFIFAIFWTWVLNLICKSGFSVVSWILVLIPIFIYIIVIIYALYVVRTTVQTIKGEKSSNAE